MKKSKPTKRKFYDKWLYKITICIPGISSIRLYSIVDIVKIIQHGDSPFYGNTFKRKILKNSNQILLFLKTLENFPEDQWGKRIENNNIDVYTNNKLLFDTLSKLFADETIHRFEPLSSLDLFSSGGVCVVNKYPFDQYQYKVMLQPHRLMDDRDRKRSFLNWLDTQGEKVRISDATKEWFINTSWNWDRRYMYVDTDQTLLMVTMREKEALGRTYKYVLADK